MIAPWMRQWCYRTRRRPRQTLDRTRIIEGCYHMARSHEWHCQQSTSTRRRAAHSHPAVEYPSGTGLFSSHLRTIGRGSLLGHTSTPRQSQPEG